MRYLITALLLLALPAAVEAAIHDLGTFGATYSIAEKDALAEIRERASQIDWTKYFNRKRMAEAVKNYRPDNIARLPRATENRTFTVDMTYTLEFDIPDGKGGILYPKGYTFNPLSYVQLPNILVVIDASDDRQVKWLSSSEYITDYRTMLLITGGSAWDTAHRLERPVFYATRQIVDRLQLKAVPSVIRQLSDKYMQVQEVEIERTNSSDNSAADSACPDSVSAE